MQFKILCFCLALGYKADVVKDYFLNYRAMSSDFSINLESGELKETRTEKTDWNVTLVDTGMKTMTGGRIKRLRDQIAGETFMVTYGDGLANVNISALLSFHQSHGKMVTVTAVRPSARFGELEIEGDNVTSFVEKSQLHQGWINGGFLVIEPEFLDLIDGDDVMLEREPLERAAKMGEMKAYFHHDFWQCMDTKRDHELLEKLWLDGAPWTSH